MRERERVRERVRERERESERASERDGEGKKRARGETAAKPTDADRRPPLLSSPLLLSLSSLQIRRAPSHRTPTQNNSTQHSPTHPAPPCQHPQHHSLQNTPQHLRANPAPPSSTLQSRNLRPLTEGEPATKPNSSRTKPREWRKSTGRRGRGPTDNICSAVVDLLVSCLVFLAEEERSSFVMRHDLPRSATNDSILFHCF